MSHDRASFAPFPAVRNLPLRLRYTRGSAAPCRGPSKVERYTPASGDLAGHAKASPRRATDDEIDLAAVAGRTGQPPCPIDDGGIAVHLL
jgi:hypothetical protein